MNDALPLAITIGDKYGPAMEIQTQDEADAYFERCVEHTMLHLVNDGKAATFTEARPEAERIERMNLGYFAGYYDHNTRARVERLFRCEHPIFGAIAERGAPTADEALVSGLMQGLGLRAAGVPREAPPE